MLDIFDSPNSSVAKAASPLSTIRKIGIRSLCNQVFNN